MPVQPDDVAAKTFPRRWRGYDRSRVEGFLATVAADYAAAIDRIGADAEDRTRARSSVENLIAQLGAVLESTHLAAEAARRDAATDADAIRARADHTAVLIIGRAEDAAAALIRQAESLRAGAQADADAARERLADADRRAQQIEDAARERWEALRAETERRWDRLQAAERRLDERIQHAHAAVGSLRSQVALLDQVQQVEGRLAALRADGHSPRADLQPAGEHNGAAGGAGPGF